MTSEQILGSTFSKAEKARRLYDLGMTRHQVADLICGGNYGWAHNLYKKHFGLETIHRALPDVFNHKFGVEIEAFGIDMRPLAEKLALAGISVEVENYNHSTRRHWKLVTDGSVQGTNAFELVSPVLKGAAGIAEVKKVCEVLEAAGVKVNKSCGLHIHFDARDLSMNDWKNLYKNYINVESELDAIMPVSRRGNNNTYCQSVMHRFNSKERAFAAIENSNTVNGLSSAVANNGRYVKLNAESFTRHGTVEFRHHSGTVEFKKIGGWIKICAAMIDKSKTAVVNSLNEILPQELQSYVNDRKRKFAA